MESVTVQIPKELYSRINQIAELRKTQDNRATADPLYFTVREDNFVRCEIDEADKIAIWIPADADSCDIDYLKESLIINHEVEIPESYDTWIKNGDWHELEEWLRSVGMDGEVYGLKNIYQECNAFFTEHFCQLHINNNAYNLVNPHSYARHAYRNPEMKAVLELIDLFVKVDDIQSEEHQMVYGG